MHNGHTLLWRKSLNPMTWKDRKPWRSWPRILLSARWQAGRNLPSRQPVELGPGELLAPLEGLVQATGPSLKEVRSAAPTAWGTRISIVNWQEYHGSEAASGKKKPPRQAQPFGTPQPMPHRNADKIMGAPSGLPCGQRRADARRAHGPRPLPRVWRCGMCGRQPPGATATLAPPPLAQFGLELEP